MCLLYTWNAFHGHIQTSSWLLRPVIHGTFLSVCLWEHPPTLRSWALQEFGAITNLCPSLVAELGRAGQKGVYRISMKRVTPRLLSLAQETPRQGSASKENAADDNLV